MQREVQPCEGESREWEQVGRRSRMLGENCPGHMKGGGYPVGLGVGLVEGGSPWCRCQPLPAQWGWEPSGLGDPPLPLVDPFHGAGEKEDTVQSEWGSRHGVGALLSS